MFKDLYELEQWNDITEHQKIGEILMSSGKINLIHLAMALDAQKFQKLPLGKLFVMIHAIPQADLSQSLVVQKYIDDRIADGVV